MFTVTFLNAHTNRFEVSRYLRTERAARNWARWLVRQSFVTRACVYRGPAGGEHIDTYYR